MTSLRAIMNEATQSLDRLSLRERLLVFSAILLTLLLLGDWLLLAPLWARRSRLAEERGRLTATVAETVAATAVLAVGAAADPDADNRQRIAVLRAEIAEIDARLRRQTATLVEPGEMAGLLRELLRSGDGLKLLALENLPPQPLTAGAAEAGSEGANLYRHGLRLELEGSYLSVLSYVQALEQLPRRFFWDGLELEVVAYPRARVVLSLHTLSLRPEWIGV